MSSHNARRALLGLRLTLGVVAYVAPSTAARIFGIDPDESPAMESAVRLFGARELALGLGLVGAESIGGRRWLALGLVVDSLDVLTVALGARGHRLGRHTVIVGGGLASVAVGLGLRSIAVRQPASR
jgi:hypothetical protein